MVEIEAVNALRSRRNRRHFADDIFKCIFLTKAVWNSIEISLKFIPKGYMNNILALVQIMAWRRLGDQPISEPMMVILLTHICVTPLQRVKDIAVSHRAFLNVCISHRNKVTVHAIIYATYKRIRHRLIQKDTHSYEATQFGIKHPIQKYIYIYV